MPKFSRTSLDRLETCHADLQRLMHAVIEEVDCTILCGHRTQDEQDKAFAAGNSKLRFPHSKHNKFPSRAVDVAPWPIDWKDIGAFRKLSEVVKRKAHELEIDIEWGGDWRSFKDYPHYELKG
jgi:peptidoglycan L-alanyl-D-glutamate endopeptidase CwlK